MNDSQDLKKRLKDLAAVSSQHTDEILEDELQTLLSVSQDQLEKLRPRITDEETYNRLAAALEEATRCNEQTTQLKERLLEGGTKLVNVGKIAAKLLPGL